MRGICSSRRGSSPYASCVTIEEAKDGLFAWRLQGQDIAPDRGWPLRFVTPGYKWAYKSVKWVERITFLESFQPGMWEERVGDPKGDIPWDVLQRYNEQREVWRGSRTAAMRRDTYLTLEQVLAQRRVPQRDCRDCPKFVPDADGLRVRVLRGAQDVGEALPDAAAGTRSASSR